MLFITFGRERKKKTSENKSIRGVLAAKKPKQDKKKFLFGVFVREVDFPGLTIISIVRVGYSLE